MDSNLRYLERQVTLHPQDDLLRSQYFNHLKKVDFELFIREAQRWLVERYPVQITMSIIQEHRDGGGVPGRNRPRRDNRKLIFAITLNQKTDAVEEVPIYQYSLYSEADHARVIGVNRRYKNIPITVRGYNFSKTLISQLDYAIKNPPFCETEFPKKEEFYYIAYGLELQKVRSEMYYFDALEKYVDSLGLPELPNLTND